MSQRKSMAGKNRFQSSMTGDSEENPEFDDEGRPLTIQAAQKTYHKDGNPLHFHSQSRKYQSSQEAQQDLAQGQIRIQQLIQKARFSQLNQIGDMMGEALSTDNKVANMPNVRVLPRSHNLDQRNTNGDNNYSLTTKSLLNNARPNHETDHDSMGIPEYKTTSGRKPKIDYAMMLQKVQKNIHGEQKPTPPPVFEAAKPQHKYDSNQLAMRTMFKEIVKKQRHSVQYDDYDLETGQSHQQIAQNLVNDKSTLGNTSIYKIDTKSTYSVSKGSTMKLAFGNGGLNLTKRNQYYTAHSKTPVHQKPIYSTPGQSANGFRQTFFTGGRSFVVSKRQSRNQMTGSRSIGLQPMKGNAQSLTYDNGPRETGFTFRQTEMDNTVRDAYDKLNNRMLGRDRIQHKIRVIQPLDDDDENKPELFTANPSEEIPRNKLTEKLARGLQAYVQRMQKRESFYAELQVLPHQNWMPAPREYSTLTYCNNRNYLIGGLNFEANNEVASMRMYAEESSWSNIGYSAEEKILGRCRHTACTHNDKIYVFGGCFMFNRKRQIRECTSQVLVYDTVDQTFNQLRTKGLSVQPRKDHCAAVFGQSMLVYGGQFENGALNNDLLNLDLQYNDWTRMQVKQLNYEPFIQQTCCSVQMNKRSGTSFEDAHALGRISDTIFDGIYYFGGKNQQGEIQNKLRFLKPQLADGKVVAVEWQKIKQQGNPPCARVGHQMLFLPCNQCLVIAGGRNDQECKNMNIPFLDDMYLFLLDQKSWIEVAYIPKSQRLCKIGNHSMTVMTDGETFEKIIIFGGISNFKNEDHSALVNTVIQIEIRQVM